MPVGDGFGQGFPEIGALQECQPQVHQCLRATVQRQHAAILVNQDQALGGQLQRGLKGLFTDALRAWQARQKSTLVPGQSA